MTILDESGLLSPETAAVAKVKCLKSLLFQTKLFFIVNNNKKFIVDRVHEIIVDALEKVLRGEVRRLIICMPPRYGKTELAVKGFISHGLALNPKAKFIHLSHGDDLALDNSEKIKDTISLPLYKQLFPSVRIKKDATAKDKWYTTEGGGVLARAAGGQVTGFGAGIVEETEEQIKQRIEQEALEMDEFMTSIEKNYDDILDAKFEFGGAIVIDDSIKPEDADSDTKREAVNSRYDSTIATRTNSRKTPIINIMHRLHPRDLVGYMLRDESEDRDEWLVISLPAINQVGNQFNLVPGEALYPHKHTIEELLKLKKSNDIVFERQYMQNPKPKEGLLFPEDDLEFSDMDNINDEDVDHSHMSVDPANLGGDDFAAIHTKLIGKKIYVTNVLYNTEGEDVNSQEVVDMTIKLKPNGIGIEGVFGWAETVKAIRLSLEKKSYEGEIRQLRPRTAKHVRITSRSAFIRNHFVFYSGYNKLPQYQKFMQNLTSYKKVQEPGSQNKHDEAPDVCEMEAMYYQKAFPELWDIV